MTRRRIALKLAVIGLLGLVVAVFFGYRALAAGQPAISLTTSPVTLNLNIAPGSSSTQIAEVMNNGDQPLPINMEVMTFGAYGTSGEAAITKIPASSSESSYIKLTPSSFIAQPKVWSKVQVKINLPAGASLGYYYAIVFQPVYPNTEKLNGTVIHGSNAVLALINTNSSNELKQVSVADFSISHHIFSYLPANFSVNIRNSGNIYLAPHGDIFIARNSSGTNPLATLAVNGGDGNVLPQSNRVFTASWSDGFPVYENVYKNGQPVVNTKGLPVQHLKWDFSKVNKFRFGEYYAHLIMIYNNGSRTVLLNGTLSFWVIPWGVLLPIVLIILILLLNAFLIGRVIYRRIISRKYPRKIKT